MDKIQFRSLHSINFIIYTKDDILKLSVLEITNPNAFDALDHPTTNGLYDLRLGSMDQRDTCQTCGLTSVHCPGHFGHILFPLPVFHPVLLEKMLFPLLRGTCFQCHRLMAPKSAIYLVIFQLKALECGLVSVVHALEEAVADTPVLPSTAGKAEIEAEVFNRLKFILDDAVNNLNAPEEKSSARVKNVVDCRNQIVKNFIKEYLMSGKKKCPHCGAEKEPLRLHNSKSKIISIKGTGDGSYLSPMDAKQHINFLWEQENVLLKHLFSVFHFASSDCYNPTDILFMDALLIPPSRFRPLSVIKGRKFLHPRSVSLKDVLQDSIAMHNLLQAMRNEELDELAQDSVSKIRGENNVDKFYNIYQSLQMHVNGILDSDLDKTNKEKGSQGVKQVLEKKEGMIRRNMMGKRVNFAARSVISPDPNIMIDEIGVPTTFAKVLTYPEAVTHWNVEKLRAVVNNGPGIYPGAVRVDYEDGTAVRLDASDPNQRHAIACKLLTPSTSVQKPNIIRPKIVHRHLQNGDVLLLNRQPTLHKPSIMAHRARVLPSEKTLRLHYANCKSYNADFDGDEMNAHFPQSELGRAEGYNIVSVNHQYLVPKDGTPLSGLIQDHVIAGTLLTLRGRFFKRDDYHQLVYEAIPFLNKPIKILPPSIIRPEMLWSGKQVVSTVIINVIPGNKPPPSVEGKANILPENWKNMPSKPWTVGGTPLEGNNMSESEVIISSGELLCGVIDKANIGPKPYGLIHCCYELYGGETSTALLTSFARLFTNFLRIHTGFTLGIEDILLTDKATRKRLKLMKEAKKVGDQVASKALNVTDPNNKNELTEKFREAHLNKAGTDLSMLDFEMNKVTTKYNNKIQKICIHKGLLKKFPQNNLQLMVQSGSKGSLVNAMQISCLLGQTDLEGKRVPLMMNGSTLPSFLPYDTSPCAGGFVDGRFLTGIKPQEYFFHCMAGREGLIDTAVKTSHSGYLQRCLIKHLEGVTVNYDMTVRDSDGSVIQFLYGEDGLDVCKMQMLKPNYLHLLLKNYNAVINETEINIIKEQQMDENLATHKKSVRRWKKKHGVHQKENRCSAFLKFEKENSQFFANITGKKQNEALKECWCNLDFKQKKKYLKYAKKCPDPVNFLYQPDVTFGSVSEKLDNIIEDYINRNPHSLISSQEKNCNHKSYVGLEKTFSAEKFRNLSYYRALRSLAQPGEAVGLLAAQSIGEPSTQMTLNTFHFAGRGEMNVTLGIPRLREIFMGLQAKNAALTMDLPLLNIPEIESKAEDLRLKLSSVYLKQVLESVEIQEKLCIKAKSRRFREYIIKMEFLPHNAYEGTFYTSPSRILYFIEHSFVKRIYDVIKKKLKAMSRANLVKSATRNTNDEEANHSRSVIFNDSEEDDEQPDVDQEIAKNINDDEFEYDEPDAEENIAEETDEENSDVEHVAMGNPVAEVEDENDDIDCKPVIFDNIINKKASTEEKRKRIDFVIKAGYASDYDFDDETEEWCQFTIQLCLEDTKLDMKTLIEDEVNKAVVYHVPNIKKAYLVDNPNPGTNYHKMLQTDGVNFLKIFEYEDIIDIRKVYSNDIPSIVEIYGIEAATRVIVKEIIKVFTTYGITVDSRHLLLLADYMTYEGKYKYCNRYGMESNASPLQQMTFETSMNFLRSATVSGAKDNLKSPSSRLMLGDVVNCGTGFFDLLVNPKCIKPSKKKGHKNYSA